MKTAFLVLALALSACSWIAVKKPPIGYMPPAPIECTDLIGFPFIDTVMALGSLGGAALLLFIASERGPYADDAGIPGLASSLMGIAYTASAVSGYRSVSKCRELKAKHPSHLLRAPHTSP